MTGCEETGYKEVQIGKWKTGYKKIEEPDLRRKMINESGNEFGATQNQVLTRDKGNETDLLKYWEFIYKKEGWNKYAAFSKKAGINTPYALFIHSLRQKTLQTKKPETKNGKKGDQ